MHKWTMLAFNVHGILGDVAVLSPWRPRAECLMPTQDGHTGRRVGKNLEVIERMPHD